MRIAAALALALALALPACGDDAPETPPPGEPPAHRGPERGPEEPDRVEVLSLLLDFQGSGAPGGSSERTRADARELAFTVAAAIREGADAREAFAEHDRLRPGEPDRAMGGTLHRLANTDVATAENEVPRGNVEKGLGDLAFSLAPGAVGVVEWSREESPLGYRVVVRLK